MSLVTLIFPAGVTNFSDSAGNKVTADATGRCVVDPLSVDLQNFIDEGFTTAPDQASAVRPTVTYPGQLYFDTTLNAGAGLPIFRNASNTAWINAAGVVV